jgi:hypothetical protein
LISRPHLPEEGPIEADPAPVSSEAPEAGENQDGDEAKGSLEESGSTTLPPPDTSPMYPYFLMLHAYFYTICLVFRYTSWHFFAFSETNLLTRCHSASSLFSAVFVFQKSYTGNILGIGRNQS